MRYQYENFKEWLHTDEGIAAIAKSVAVCSKHAPYAWFRPFFAIERHDPSLLSSWHILAVIDWMTENGFLLRNRLEFEDTASQLRLYRNAFVSY